MHHCTPITEQIKARTNVSQVWKNVRFEPGRIQSGMNRQHIRRCRLKHIQVPLQGCVPCSSLHLTAAEKLHSGGAGDRGCERRARGHRDHQRAAQWREANSRIVLRTWPWERRIAGWQLYHTTLALTQVVSGRARCETRPQDPSGLWQLLGIKQLCPVYTGNGAR